MAGASPTPGETKRRNWDKPPPEERFDVMAGLTWRLSGASVEAIGADHARLKPHTVASRMGLLRLPSPFCALHTALTHRLRPGTLRLQPRVC